MDLSLIHILYLNTWHGIALKYIGNDCPGRKDYNFDTVNYLTVSGDYDERVFKSAFNANKSSYLRCGMPRNEELWNASDADRLKMREKLNIPDSRKVILYAPTWRESTDGGKSYAITPPIHFERWEKELGDQYVVLFRAHHQTCLLYTSPAVQAVGGRIPQRTADLGGADLQGLLRRDHEPGGQ